ncbi:BatD family protein [Aquimarina agarilytica]|uniref:BatD family protein n=1 Tax=Aquimarina agarilytica TaxID=1087449 RepID=UPI000288F722|nr:BatD family protein [Aquimarina agarilytica]
MILKKLLTGILLLLSSVLMAQVNFVAKVNKKKLGMNERLKVVFEMNADGDNFLQPNFNGFRVSSGPSQSVSRSWINGKSSYKKTFTYFLTPTKVGTFKIGQASIQVKGERYKTLPIAIQVTSAVENPSEGENPDFVADRSLHLVAKVSNPNPYLNEAVTLEYRLYWDPEVTINMPQEVDSPKFRDFWSQNIEIKQLRAENGTYKGRQSAFVVLKKVVLYPQKTGKLKLTPLTLSVPVQVPTNRRDIFGRRLTNTVNKNVSAGNTIVNVKPLPANPPAGFDGAVGSFNFRVSQTKNNLKASESLQVKVEVQGKGNLKLFQLPKLKAPTSIEMYDPEHKENVRTRLSGMSGSISDTYTLVPQYKGNYPIPTIKFSYFDPKAGVYKTKASSSLSVNVLEGPTPQNAGGVPQQAPGANDNTDAVAQQKVVAPAAQFSFIKTAANLKPIKQITFFKTTAYWLSLLLPLLVVPVVILITKTSAAYASDTDGNKARQATKLAKKYLSSAKKNLGDATNFYVALEKALHNYLKAKLRIETSEMNKEHIHELLASKSVDEEAIEGYVQLLGTCDMARYTPSTQQTMEQDYKKASQVIAKIDKQL